MPYFSNFHGYSTGYWTNSCSSRLTSINPPTSSHVTLGVYTCVSRSADGLVFAIDSRKCSCVTAIALSTSASMVSSYQSITDIFSRIHCIAASVQSCAKSDPTNPCESLAMRYRSTSYANFINLV